MVRIGAYLAGRRLDWAALSGPRPATDWQLSAALRNSRQLRTVLSAYTTLTHQTSQGQFSANTKTVENFGVANLLERQYFGFKQRPKSAAFHKHYKIMLSRLNWPAASLRELLSLRLSGAPRQFDKLGGRGGPALQLVN